MSRDLKSEYEAMLDQEIPDLWSRIEPRLADKKGTQNAEPKGKSIRTRRIKRSTVAVWGSLAAACVCLAIIIPAWNRSEKSADGTNQMESGSAMNTAAADTSAADNSTPMMEAESDGSAMNGMETEVSYDVSAEDTDMLQSESFTPTENDGIADDAAAWENGIPKDVPENVESAEAVPAEDESEKGSGTDAEPLSQYECCGEITDAWQTREGFFYRMELIGDPENRVFEGSEILIWQKAGFLSGLPGAQDAALTTGNRYRIVVKPEIVDGETRYVLVETLDDESEDYE